MRLREFVTEARRNPDLNPKLSAYDQIKARYDRTTDYIDANTKNLFVNFLGVEKLGVNPNPSYTTTPIGVYAYPVKWLLQNLRSDGSVNRFIYAVDEPYFNLFNVDYTNIMNIEDYPRAPEFIDQLARIHSNLSGTTFEQSHQLIEDLLNNTHGYHINLYNDVKFLCRELFNRQLLPYKFRSRMTTIFKKLGFSGVYDPGYGDIHNNEPAQLVVFDLNAIKNNQRILNKSYAVDSQFRDDSIKLASLMNNENSYRTRSKIIDIIDEYYNNDDPNVGKLIRKASGNLQLRKQLIYMYPDAINYLKNPIYQEKIQAVSNHLHNWIHTDKGLMMPDVELSDVIKYGDVDEYFIVNRLNDKLTDQEKIELLRKNPQLIFEFNTITVELADLAIKLGIDRTRINNLWNKLFGVSFDNDSGYYDEIEDYFKKKKPRNRFKEDIQ